MLDAASGLCFAVIVVERCFVVVTVFGIGILIVNALVLITSTPPQLCCSVWVDVQGSKSRGQSLVAPGGC